MTKWTDEELSSMAAYDAKIDASPVTVKMLIDVDRIEHAFGLVPELSYKQQQYAREREKQLECVRNYRARNKSKAARYADAYRKAHKEDYARRNREYRLRKKLAVN